jgi:hypothetical protein
MAQDNVTNSDRILELLKKAVEVATMGNAAVSVVAVSIMNAVNLIADLIGSRRVTIEEVITALEARVDMTDAFIRAQIERLRAETNAA